MSDDRTDASDAADQVEGDDAAPCRWTQWRVTRLVAGLLWLLLVGTALVLLLAWLLPQDFTAESRPYLLLASVAFVVRVFQLHLALLLLGPCVLALLLRRKRLAVVGVVLVVIASLPYVARAWQGAPEKLAGPTLTIFSLNVFAKNPDPTLVLAEIERVDPDVIVLIELTGRSGKAILPALEAEYPHRFDPKLGAGGVIVSRVPFRVGASTGFSEPQGSRIPAIFTLEGRELSIYGVHLISPSRTLNQDSPRDLLGTLAFAVRENRRQVLQIESILRDDPRPTVFAGDFNFTPTTPNFVRLNRAGLTSGADFAATGSRTTWRPVWWPILAKLPGIEIDHVMLETPLRADRHEVGNYAGSDHLPVITRIGWSDAER